MVLCWMSIWSLSGFISLPNYYWIVAKVNQYGKRTIKLTTWWIQQVLKLTAINKKKRTVTIYIHVENKNKTWLSNGKW